jgi:hypothetical protein
MHGFVSLSPILCESRPGRLTGRGLEGFPTRSPLSAGRAGTAATRLTPTTYGGHTPQVRRTSAQVAELRMRVLMLKSGRARFRRCGRVLWPVVRRR